MDSVKIVKHLRIDSIVEFYNIVKSKEYIIQLCPTLIRFREYMELYLVGCLCEVDVNYQKSLDIYKNLKSLIDPIVWVELKKIINCDSFLFYLKTGSDCILLFNI